MIKVGEKIVDWIHGEKIEMTLKRVGVYHPFMAVSLNGKLLRREQWATIEVKDEDRIRTVEMIAGG